MPEFLLRFMGSTIATWSDNGDLFERQALAQLVKK
jgi:hypothetical protein